MTTERAPVSSAPVSRDTGARVTETHYKPDPMLLREMIGDVFGAFLSPIVERKVKITAWPWLNVRAGAGTSYTIVRRLLHGTVVQIGEVQVVSVTTNATLGEQWGRCDGGGWISMRWTVEA